MLPITSDLNKSLQSIGFVDERLKLLANKYEGETAYILAAGPSLNNHSINKLKDKLKDKLVFCIKQPYYNFKDICDFLFLNFTNLSPFNFNPDTIVSWAYWFENHPEVIQKNQWKADLLYPVFRNSGEMEYVKLMTSWENLAKEMLNYQDYKDILNKKRIANKMVLQIINEEEEAIEKVRKIYSFVQTANSLPVGSINWNRLPPGKEKISTEILQPASNIFCLISSSLLL